VGPRAILDAVVKRKIPSLRRESNPRTPIVQPVAQPSSHIGTRNRKRNVTGPAYGVKIVGIYFLSERKDIIKTDSKSES
jgi:hypothetical protein